MRDRGFGRSLGRMAGAIALGVALHASGASALTIGGPAPFEVDPVYYKSGGQFGFATAEAFDVIASNSAADWHDAGVAGSSANLFLTVSIALETPVWQNPQAPGSSLNTTGPVSAPTADYPYVADSIWTVTNTSGQLLENPLLVFTRVRVGEITSLVPGGYPDIATAIDDNLMLVAKLQSGASTMYFGALALGTLAPGASTEVRVRYIVAGNLPINGSLQPMPSFGLAALTSFEIPEPGTFTLVAGGAALLAAARRRRCR